MRLASNANTDKTVITMSRKEFFRLHILIGLSDSARALTTQGRRWSDQTPLIWRAIKLINESKET
jgi:hypothetical protein